MKKVLAVLLLLAAFSPRSRAQATANLTASDSGACTTANACLVVPVKNGVATAVVQLTGTFSGTVQFEGTPSASAAGTFVAVSAFPLNSSTAVTSATAVGAWRIAAAGLTAVRVRCSTYSSGTIATSINTSTASAGTIGGGGGGGGGQSSIYSATTYGAIADARQSRNCATTTSSHSITSTDNPWTAGDVGKFVYLIYPPGGITTTTNVINTITGFTNSGTVTINGTGTGTGGSLICVWFTQKETSSIVKAVVAATPVLSPLDPAYQTPALSYPGTAYLPAGGYVIDGRLLNQVGSTNNSLPVNFIGAGPGQVVLYISPDFTVPGSGHALLNWSLVDGVQVGGFEIEGSDFLSTGYVSGQALIGVTSGNYLKTLPIWINDFGTGTSGSSTVQLQTVSYSDVSGLRIQGVPTGTASTLLNINGFGGTFEHSLISNGAINLAWSGGARGANGVPADIFDVFVDECGSPPCTQITGSLVNILSSTFYGAPAMSADGTSSLYLTGDNIGQFNNSTNTTALTLASGAQVFANGTTFRGNGSSAAITGPGSGSATFFDLNGNLFQECSGTNCPSTSNIITGNVNWFGSGSITGVAQTSGNVALTSGWGSGAAVSAVSGNSLREQFTITFGSSPGASPVVTVTFPSPFAVAPICTLRDVGGTGALPTSIVNGSISATTAAFTVNGTFTSGTEIFQVECGN